MPGERRPVRERRAEPRLMCSDLIKVRLEDAGADAAEMTVNLEDISPSGACVLFAEPVAAGARVCLRLGRYKFRGRVQYTTHNEIGYFAGIRFDAGRKWSRKMYEPEHLLDPRKVGV